MWVSISDKYEASSDGQIRNKCSKRILHQFVNNSGYLMTQFDGKTKSVHRVIAMAFIPNPNDLPEVNHINGNKLDNRVENLEWCTRGQNLKHAYDNQLRTSKGTNNGRCKLSIEDVTFIKQNYIYRDKEFGACALAKKFNVAPQTIYSVVHGFTW